MIAINNVLISDAILEEAFVCNLSACKGECCIAGDNGAPLEDSEGEILAQDINEILHYLTDEGKEAILEQGTSVYSKRKLCTPLINDGACAYVIYEGEITKCGIEKAHQEGKTTFKKPVSCHLYPIRHTKSQFHELLNYDTWDICKSACSLGKELKVPVYKFLKEPLIRKFGKDFYAELDRLGTKH